MELVDMRVLGTRAFGVSVRVRPGAMETRILTTVRLPDSGDAVVSSERFDGRSCLYLLRPLTMTIGRLLIVGIV